MNNQDLRLTLLIQVLTVFLVIKSIASTYFASYYSIHKQDQLVWEYAHTLSYLSFLLIIPIILISLGILLPLSEKKKRYFDIISVIIILLSVIVSFVFF